MQRNPFSSPWVDRYFSCNGMKKDPKKLKLFLMHHCLTMHTSTFHHHPSFVHYSLSLFFVYGWENLEAEINYDRKRKVFLMKIPYILFKSKIKRTFHHCVCTIEIGSNNSKILPSNFRSFTSRTFFEFPTDNNEWAKFKKINVTRTSKQIVSQTKL